LLFDWGTKALEHTWNDVVPYYIFGNTPEDRNTSDRWKTTFEPITKPIVDIAKIALKTLIAQAFQP
jgi:hypothetical protein